MKEIQELIEYLKDVASDPSSSHYHMFPEGFEKWATAVERLEESRDYHQAENKRYMAQIQVYERILVGDGATALDKGKCQHEYIFAERFEDRAMYWCQVCHDVTIKKEIWGEDKAEKPEDLTLKKVREAIVFSGKHVGAWTDSLTEEVMNGKSGKLLLDIRSLEEYLTADTEKGKSDAL